MPVLQGKGLSKVSSAGVGKGSGMLSGAPPHSDSGLFARIVNRQVENLHLTSAPGTRVYNEAQRPSGPAAQRPSGPAAQRPSGPAAQRPSGPAA